MGAREVRDAAPLHGPSVCVPVADIQKKQAQIEAQKSEIEALKQSVALLKAK